jgi:hypothetical protein
MYLAKQVGRWSTTIIGCFYNGRDHSTVCIEAEPGGRRAFLAAERAF